MGKKNKGILFTKLIFNNREDKSEYLSAILKKAQLIKQKNRLSLRTGGLMRIQAGFFLLHSFGGLDIVVVRHFCPLTSHTHVGFLGFINSLEFLIILGIAFHDLIIGFFHGF